MTTQKYSNAVANHETLASEKLLPLKPITIGRGVCDPQATNVSRASCGGKDRGTCTPGFVCECKKGWMGPHCLVPNGYDPIMYEIPESLSDLEFTGPYIYNSSLWIGLCVLGILGVLAPTLKRRMDGWTPISDLT